MTIGLRQNSETTHEMDGDAIESPTENLLSGAIRRGVTTAVPAFFVIGFLLATVGGHDISLVGRIGIGLFVAFWSGPFFGLSSGMAYHQLMIECSNAEPTAKIVNIAATPTVLTSARVA